MVRKILNLFIVSRLVFLVFAILAIDLIPLEEGYLGRQHYPDEPYLAWIWANFDGRHFADIVVSGYRDFNFAFFPLYPLLIRFLDYHLLIDPPYVGIIISLICYFLSLMMVYKIIILDYKESVARLSIYLLAFFPLSFFYQAMYSDSLFILLSVTGFYFARKGKWIYAGVFGGLTTLTRIAGVAIIPALAVEWCLQNQSYLNSLFKRFDSYKFFTLFKKFITTGFVAVFISGLGILSYFVYLQLFYGDWLLFQKSMIAWRQNEFTFPPQVIFRYLKIFLLVDRGLLVYWVALLEFISMIFYFILTYYVAKKIRISYAVLMFFVLILPTFTGTFAGMPRYVLHAFPAFLGMAVFLSTRKRFTPAVVTLFLILGFIFTGLFTRGHFIA